MALMMCTVRKHPRRGSFPSSSTPQASSMAPNGPRRHVSVYKGNLQGCCGRYFSAAVMKQLEGT